MLTCLSVSFPVDTTPKPSRGHSGEAPNPPEKRHKGKKNLLLSLKVVAKGNAFRKKKGESEEVTNRARHWRH